MKDKNSNPREPGSHLLGGAHNAPGKKSWGDGDESEAGDRRATQVSVTMKVCRVRALSSKIWLSPQATKCLNRITWSPRWTSSSLCRRQYKWRSVP